ncbi:hypothetical protein AVEN_195484-1 [Araneus ventricosus]|uniref:Uncharacterized protein n=1 Tax=Araneus ventricosus TaxID=182803 RepID=A0A4Y2GU05_ARAVE|nr:hypothetical protein AVEN_195484-1 [Araneus ventricosus]
MKRCGRLWGEVVHPCLIACDDPEKKVRDEEVRQAVKNFLPSLGTDFYQDGFLKLISGLLFNELSVRISPEQVLESAGVYVRDAHDSALVGHIPLEHGLEDGTCHSQDHPVSSVFLGGGRRPDDEGDVRKLLLLQLVDRGDDGVLVERGGRWAGVSDGKVILDVLLGREMKDIKTSLELVNRYTHIYLECTHADPGLVKAMRIAREAAEKQPAQYKDTQGPHKLKKRQGVQDSKEGCGKVAISLSIGCPLKYSRSNLSPKNSRRKAFHEPPVTSYVAPSGIVVIAFAFQLYEREFDPRLGGMWSFVTIYNEIAQVSSVKN